MFELDRQPTIARSRKAAGWLASMGLRRGDRVALVAENHPDYIAFTMGAMCSGIVPVLLSPHLPASERAWMLDDASPAIVVDGSAWPDLDAAEERDIAALPACRPMHYTSGTTGRSKGVWSGLLSDEDAAALAADELDLWRAAEGDVVLVCSPLYHSAPHRTAVSALLHNARVLVFETFDPAAVAAAFVDRDVTHGFVVPTHLRRLLEVSFRPVRARRVLHAGEPCPEALKRQALRAFPEGSLWEFYGSTEGQFTSISPDEWLERPGSVGRARPGRQLHVRDPAPDGVGVVYVSAPRFARWEYWRDPAKTANAWKGGAFTVGDLGHLDGDGYLYLAGRRSDLIISGGVNVYPAEVERVLAEHPAVAEVAVYGLPDETWGQRVCAAVVSSGADADEIMGWARQRLPGPQRPKQVVIVDQLPRTGSGKIRRATLASGGPDLPPAR